MIPVRSIKKRITLWYAAFIVLIVGLLLAALLLSQHLFSQDYYYDILRAAMDEAKQNIQVTDGVIQLETQSDSGVRVTVLDGDGNLLVGKRSFSLRLKEGELRVRNNGREANWYLLDAPITLPGGQNVWLRCYVSTDLTERMSSTLLMVLAVMLPLLLVGAVLGGYRMTYYAMRPIDEISRMAANITDSNDLKRRIVLRRRSCNEVEQLASTFNGMFARLERSLENEKRFISDASHELRTPLSVICAQSEYALKSSRTLEEKDAALTTIHERGVRAAGMLAQMLMLSRMDYQKQPVNLERTDLSELFESLVQELQPQAQARSMEFRCELSPHVEMVCDEILMLRVATNLIQNAIQYGREGGYIRVELARQAGEVIFAVEDDGCGIAPEEQSKIWNRFYQSDKAESSGSGLGLPIVKWIVEAHKGRIELFSKPGRGSRFVLHFPQSDGALLEEKQGAEAGF